MGIVSTGLIELQFRANARSKSILLRHAFSVLSSLGDGRRHTPYTRKTMSERITLRIVPPEGGTGELTVEDAMQQVLDAFRLLTANAGEVLWRLVSASTNSPLTIVAEAEDSMAAAEQTLAFSKSIEQLQAGRFPDAWKRPELQSIAAAFLSRASGSIGRTEIRIRDEQPLLLSAEDAAPFVGLREQVSEQVPAVAYGIVTKKQVGSIEGLLVEVTTYRGRPAIRVRERKTDREITCVVSEQLANEFSEHASVHDVWTHRRVTVRGVISYQASGSILRVEAVNVEPAAQSVQPLKSLRDPNFTAGLTAADYLEKFRAGELG